MDTSYTNHCGCGAISNSDRSSAWTWGVRGKLVRVCVLWFMALESMIHEFTNNLSKTFNPRENKDSPERANEQALEDNFSRVPRRFCNYFIFALLNPL